MKRVKDALEKRLSELTEILFAGMDPGGYWEGRLSSSALAVAVAVAALFFDNTEDNSDEIEKGLRWLKNNINNDGSYGDTPASPGNISTSLLVYAALNLFAGKEIEVRSLMKKTAGYLKSEGVDVESPGVSRAILDHYKEDYTFSVPILAMCGLCGIPGNQAFSFIPQLPFELSLLPRSFYRILNLSVVSYAVPALIAVGILVWKKKKSGRLWNFVRRYSAGRAISLLQKMMPESGGYLEAIPLTAFVAVSLINSGYRETEIVRRGIHFLKSTQRDDGGWPIDIDLSTWVTSLSVKAFSIRLNDFISADVKNSITGHFKAVQNRKVHPFNGTSPGGWGWTQYPGSVPDGDDTPGVILALLRLNQADTVKDEVLAGCLWLSQLQNNDGGFPTFSRGWGKLPFDRSCSDLTGHCLLAISAVMEAYQGSLTRAEEKMLKRMFGKAMAYLEKNQSAGGSWLPLWFGNQYTEGFKNPVYGTARVTAYLRDAVNHTWLDPRTRNRLSVLTENGITFLLSVRNSDGSWGGDRGVSGTIEETALAVSALASGKHGEECLQGLEWLDSFYLKNGLTPAPVGLYFALLWYDEKMYPLVSYIDALARLSEVMQSEDVK